MCISYNSDWSEKGVETLNVTRIGTSPVQFRLFCRSSHTTPFVVLVDSQDVLNQVHKTCNHIYAYMYCRYLRKSI